MGVWGGRGWGGAGRGTLILCETRTASPRLCWKGQAFHGSDFVVIGVIAVSSGIPHQVEL